MDFYGFYTGQEFSAYEYLGAHISKEGTVFRTFAPAAESISVIGEFNGWTETPMKKVYDGNFWECFIPEAKQGQMYKYRIRQQGGRCIDHCDPYAFYSELRPATASIIWGLDEGKFHDAKYRKQHAAPDGREHQPLNIYEMHAGSWRKPKDEPASWYTYRELADLLIPYLKENGYNFVELMPLGEHPSDESWGYQATGFFSPTARYGTPDDLRYFTDQCHKHDIGVLMDFVPVHFAVNDYALHEYDGTALYEYPNSAVGYNEWGSCNFMHSRGEVRSFLQSAAWYWLKEFHFDGLRVDAVSNLIYWQGNAARGENKLTIQFIRTLNKGLRDRMPSAVLVAEDSSAYPGVTAPVENGGLGFTYKWDLGWMNDTLKFMQTDPAARTDNYHKLTFSMMYFYNEKYLLPLSHDEVVHGKATIVQKMNGDNQANKFAQARALYMYMYAHPGKKLNFMGNEIGHMREWDEKRQQDWDLLKYPIHDSFHRFMTDLSALYLKNSALWEQDFDRGGFEWADCHSESRVLYAFLRRGKEQTVLAAFNFSDRDAENYELALPGFPEGSAVKTKLLLCSDWERYSGGTKQEKTLIKNGKGKVTLTLPRFSAVYFEVS